MAKKFSLFSSRSFCQLEIIFQLSWHTRNSVKLFPEWPENSPSLNLIESLWLQTKQLQSQEKARLAPSFKGIAFKGLKERTSSYLKSLYERMLRRIQAVVET